MRRFWVFVLFALVLSASCWGWVDEKHRLTHLALMPTAYTLEKGELAIGIGPVEYGLLDNFELAANLLGLVFGTLSFGAKANVYNSRRIAFALGAAYSHSTVEVSTGSGTDEESFDVLSGSGTASFALGKNTYLHAGYSLGYLLSSVDIDSIEGGIGNLTFSGGGSVGLEFDLSKTNILGVHLLGDPVTELFGVGAIYQYSGKVFNIGLGAYGIGFAGTVLPFPYIILHWRF